MKRNLLKSRFLWKLYAGYVVLILVTTTLVGVLVARQVEEHTVGEIRKTLQSQAYFLRELIKADLMHGPTGAPSELQSRIQSLGRDLKTRLTVINRDGLVLADSEESPEKMDNHGDRPEVVEAREKGVGSAIRFSHTVKRRMIYVALAVRPDGAYIGSARASFPLTAVDIQLADLRGLVIFGAVTAALLALLLGLLFARQTTERLAHMTHAAHSLAEGQLTSKLQVSGSDEIAQLAEAFNRMVDQLHERMDTILSNRNKLAAILSSMVEGVVSVDPDERIAHLNAAALSILGVDASDKIAGKKIWEVTRTREVCEALTGAMRQSTDVIKEIRVVAKPVDQIIRIHASPLRDNDGKMAGAVVLMHDVTDLRRLETIRRDFVANVSHELKTPLTAVRGLVETMLDDSEMDSETQHRFLEKVHRQTLRLSALVTDLLTLSRVESEETGFQVSPMDVRQPVLISFRALRATGEQKNLRMAVTTPKQALTVRGDQEALRQAVDNLLDNAIKYTPEGGQVLLRVYGTERTAVIEVEDSGVGIEPVHQERIFERFYRVDQARSRELGGTGLGLSIVKHIALGLKGNVYVKSAPGRGSTFGIEIPLIPTPELMEEQKPTPNFPL